MWYSGLSTNYRTCSAIYTSDLKRAHTTAKSVFDANEATSSKPPFTVSPILREQFFGKAEGCPWDAGLFNSTHLPWEDHRAFRLAEDGKSQLIYIFPSLESK